MVVPMFAADRDKKKLEKTLNPIKDFDVQCFIKAAEELLRADETLRALDLLDNLPAYYRLNPPDEITKLKNEIQKNIATASFYATSEGYELTAPDDTHKYILDGTLRGVLLSKEIEDLNIKKLKPHLIDFAPGEFSFVRGLKARGFNFSYEPAYVNHPSYQKYRPHFQDLISKASPNQPTIFYGGEVLEHLYEERELAFEMHRRVGLADVCHISTPNMTFDFNCTDWRSKGDLGHLRTYHGQEFMSVINSIFPQYNCQVIVSQILHARCVLKTTKFDIVKEISL